MRKVFSSVVLGLLLLGALPARAAIIATITEVGDDVVAEYSGAIDLTGLTFVETTLGTAGTIPSEGALLFASAFGFSEINAFETLTGPGFGGDTLTQADMASGDFFGFLANTNRLFLSQEYVSGEEISGSITFELETLASLSLITGVYNFTLSNDDFITLTIGDPAEVPLPAAAPLMMVGLAGLTAFSRRRRQGRRERQGARRRCVERA